MTLQSAVRRYLLVAAALFVAGLLGLGYGLIGGTVGPWLDRDALIAASACLLVAGGWQLWTLAVTQLRADRQSSQLASELEMMAAVAQSTGSPVIVSDAQHHVIWCNEAFARVTGYRLDEVRGRQPGPLLRSPHADPATVARLEEAMRNFTGLDIEILHRYRDGQDRWVRMLLSPWYHSETGRATGFVAVLVNIDEQVLTRNALRNALRDNEALMHTLNEHTIVSETDRQGIITRVNRKFAEISGYSEAELVGSHHRIVNSRFHPADFWARMWTSISRGEPWSDEICNRAKDGRLYWVHSLIVPFMGSDGQIERYISIRLDITARKQAEVQLRMSEELLARTSRIAGVGGWHADLRSHGLHLSEACRDILGIHTHHDAVLEDLWRNFEPASQEQAREQLQAMARLELLSVDLVARVQGGRAGQVQWVRLVAEMDWHGAESERMIGTVQDISVQTRNQQRIEEEQRILRGAIDALGEAFVLFDPDDRLVYCNDRYRELYAPVKEEIYVGAFYENIVRAATRLAIFRESKGREETWVDNALAQHLKPYADRVVEMSDGRWLRIIEGRTADNYHVGFRLDVTELQRARLAADAAAHSKGQFLANMSHEIRTPINAIMGLLQLLSYTPLQAEQGELVRKAQTASRSLLDILNDILDYSKVEAGKMELHAETFALRELLGDLTVILSGALGEKPLDFSCDLDPRIPPVLVGDSLRLKQVLINLGGNAIKFTASGRVRVAVELRQAVTGRVRLRFSVEDTGIGITAAQQRQIFNGFSQAEASIARRFGGTGLGLAISGRLVALMGGELKVESVPGQGSVFSFEIDLPVATGEAALPPPVLAPPGASGPRLQGLRLLLAEDNRLNQEVARAMLEREGATVVLAENGQQAIETLTSEPDGYDLVLMDVQMPEVDGLQATRTIRQTLMLRDLPVLAMTANAMESDRQQCLAAGMNAHIGKPFAIDELVALILLHTGRAAPAPASTPVATARSKPAEVLEDEATLRRLGGELALLRRLRASLLPAADELRQHARQALEAGDRVAAAGMLHQLKGSAAAVGAEVLAQACAEAERRLRGEVGGAGDDAEALSVVDAAAGRTRAVLTVWLDALPPVREASSIPAGPLPEMLKADLHRLKSLLALADMEAVELYERLLALEPRLAAQDFARFNNLMEQMDLPAAAHELGGVLQGPDETL